MTVRRALLEGLAAVAGVALVAGESLETPAVAETNCTDGQCDWPTQRRGSGVHFAERISRAKVLGQLPGLRRVAAKLREPRGLGIGAAGYDPPPGSQSSGKPGTTLATEEPQNEWPGNRRAVPDRGWLGGEGAEVKKQQKEPQNDWPGRRTDGGTRADGTPLPGPTQTPPPQ